MENGKVILLTKTPRIWEQNGVELSSVASTSHRSETKKRAAAEIPSGQSLHNTDFPLHSTRACAHGKQTTLPPPTRSKFRNREKQKVEKENKKEQVAAAPPK